MQDELRTDEIRWVSANDFIEAQTKIIAMEFRRSHPKPRARMMGLKPEPTRLERWLREMGY